MALRWRDEDIQRFFGCEKACLGEAQPGHEVFTFDFSAKLLKYSIWFQITDECVMISGDDAYPFGAHSLYEIVVPCDSVSVYEDPYDPNQTGLAFWYGDPNQRMNRAVAHSHYWNRNANTRMAKSIEVTCREQ